MAEPVPPAQPLFLGGSRLFHALANFPATYRWDVPAELTVVGVRCHAVTSQLVVSISGIDSNALIINDVAGTQRDDVICYMTGTNGEQAVQVFYVVRAGRSVYVFVSTTNTGFVAVDYVLN